MKSQILYLPEHEYHNGPCEKPAFSGSMAHTLLSKSPLHAWTQHPQLGGRTKDPTKEMDRGSLIHKFILGTGPELVIVDAEKWNTKVSKALRRQAWDEGKLPVLYCQHEEARDVAQTLRARILELGYDFHGKSEVSILWTEEGIHPAPVLCKSRIDHLLADEIVEIKTGLANPKDFGKKSVNLGYDIQRIAHTSSVEALRPKLIGRIRHTTLLCELEEPFCVTPIQASGSMLELGRLKWNRALALWSRCITSQHWPGYHSGKPYLVEAPVWAHREELEREDEETEEEVA